MLKDREFDIQYKIKTNFILYILKFVIKVIRQNKKNVKYTISKTPTTPKESYDVYLS